MKFKYSIIPLIILIILMTFVIAADYIIDENGATATQGTGSSDKFFQVMISTKNITLYNFTLAAPSTATKCYVYNGEGVAGTLLGNTSISSYLCSLTTPIIIESGTTFSLAFDGGGGAMNWNYSTSSKVPSITGTNIIFTNKTGNQNGNNWEFDGWYYEGIPTVTTKENIQPDTTLPLVVISYPVANTNYTSLITLMNYSYYDLFPDSCWYSTDLGVTNSTFSSAGTNFTGLTSTQGSNTWNTFCNDTSGNLNGSSVTFKVDTLAPNLTIVYPEHNKHYNYNISELNYTISDISDYGGCFYSIDGGVTNSTITCGTNVTNLNASNASYTWRFWVNDTYGHQSNASVTFYVDTEAPIIDWVHPSESEYPLTRIHNYTLNVSVFDPYLDAVNVSVINSSGSYIYTNFTSSITYTTHYVNDNIPLNETNNTVVICGRDSLTSSPTISSFAEFTKVNDEQTTFKTLDNKVITRTITIKNSLGSVIDSKTANLATTDEWIDGGKHYKTTWELNTLSTFTIEILLESDKGKLDLLTDRKITRIVDEARTYYWRFDDMEKAGYKVSYRAIDDNSILVSVERGTAVDLGVKMTLDPITGGLNTICSNETITLDSTLPSITLIDPSNNTYTINTTLNFTSNISDVNGMVNATLHLYNETGFFNRITSSISSLVAVIIGIPATLAEGVYTWFVTSFDIAGNEGVSENRTLTIDTTNPIINFVYPTPINYTVKPIQLNYTLAELHTNTCWYSLNGGTTNTTITCGENVTGLSASEGWSTWRLWANDSAGNLDNDSVTFFTDSVAPVVNYVSPTSVDGSYSYNGIIYINVTAVDTNLQNITIRVYNTTSLIKNITINESPNYYAFTEPDGTYRINATSCDILNTCTNLNTRTITLDINYPINSPDYQIEFARLNENYSFSFNNNGINDSCVYNYNGVNKTTTCSFKGAGNYSMAAHTYNLTEGVGTFGWYGIKITINESSDVYISGFNKTQANNATLGRLHDTNEINLSICTFTNNYCKFDSIFKLNKSATYYITTNNYAIRYQTVTYPSLMPMYSLTAGYASGTDNSDDIYNIQALNLTNIREEYLELKTYANRSLLFYYNNTDGTYSWASRNWTYLIFSNGESYNSSTYETAYELYSMNFTYNSSVYSSLTAHLNYNGTQYIGTLTEEGDYLGVKTATIKRTLSMPEITSKLINKVYWNFMLTNSTATINVNSTPIYQIVDPIYLKYCPEKNSSYLNISYKNETALSQKINASVQSSTFSYWLGNGDVKKTFSYSNVTEWNSHRFCFEPVSKSINLDLTYSYKNTESNQRTYKTTSMLLTNATTEKVLWLLPSSSSTSVSYVTIQVINSASQPIADATVTVSRAGFGVVETRITDDSGAVSILLDLDQTYTIDVTHSSYTSASVTTSSGQTTYTISLGGSATTNTTDYVKGILISINPKEKTLSNNTQYEFNMTINSSYYSLDRFGFELKNGSGTYITAVSSTVSNGIVRFTGNVGTNSSIIMNYYWIINGTSTNRSTTWIIYNLEYSNYGIKKLITDFKDYISEGDGLFGLKVNSFALTLIVFFVIFIIVGGICYNYGITEPLAISFFIFFLTVLVDIFGILPKPINLRLIDISVAVLFAGITFIAAGIRRAIQ